MGTSGGEKEEDKTGRQKRGGGGGQIFLADGTSGSPGTKNKSRPAGVCVCIHGTSRQNVQITKLLGLASFSLASNVVLYTSD